MDKLKFSKKCKSESDSKF